MLGLHLFPFGFIIAKVYTDLPIGVKAYFLAQVVATGIVIDMIFGSVTSVKSAFGAYLALFQEAIIILGVGLCGVLFWTGREYESTRGRETAAASSLVNRINTDQLAHGTRSTASRSIRVRSEIVVGLFLCSLVAARLIAVIFPTLPSSGASLLSTPEVTVYQSELFGNNYQFVVQLLKVIRLDLYLVIGLIALLAMFPFGSDISPHNMKYSYLSIGTIAQIVILPAVTLSVFGFTIFDRTIIPPNASVDLVGNFSALAAPIFLLMLVVGAVTREFLRKAEHTYGS